LIRAARAANRAFAEAIYGYSEYVSVYLRRHQNYQN